MQPDWVNTETEYQKLPVFFMLHAGIDFNIHKNEIAGPCANSRFGNLELKCDITYTPNTQYLPGSSRGLVPTRLAGFME